MGASGWLVAVGQTVVVAQTAGSDRGFTGFRFMRLRFSALLVPPGQPAFRVTTPAARVVGAVGVFRAIRGGRFSL
jgi:hypothetical protein